MSNGRVYRRSITGALILIAFGVLFLYANLRPDFDPWSVLSRYWPLILIFWGLGRIFDYFMFERTAGNDTPTVRVSHGGEVLAIIALVVLFFIAVGHSRTHATLTHEQKSVDVQGAKSLNVSVEIPAGELHIAGGASATKALEADFAYRKFGGGPRVDYDVNGGQASLSIGNNESHITTHFGGGDNHWDLRLNDALPSDLKIEMGAGRSDLQLKGMDLGHLDLEMGVGEMEADLTGDWKRNLDVHIQGGVGSATIRLPKNVGVEVTAHGGIGSVNTDGLVHRDDTYVNDAFGKNPVTVRVDIEGGVGHIHLISER